MFIYFWGIVLYFLKAGIQLWLILRSWKTCLILSSFRFTTLSKRPRSRAAHNVDSCSLGQLSDCSMGSRWEGFAVLVSYFQILQLIQIASIGVFAPLIMMLPWWFSAHIRLGSSVDSCVFVTIQVIFGPGLLSWRGTLLSPQSCWALLGRADEVRSWIEIDGLQQRRLLRKSFTNHVLMYLIIKFGSWASIFWEDKSLIWHDNMTIYGFFDMCSVAINRGRTSRYFETTWQHLAMVPFPFCLAACSTGKGYVSVFRLSTWMFVHITARRFYTCELLLALEYLHSLNIIFRQQAFDWETKLCIVILCIVYYDIWWVDLDKDVSKYILQIPAYS